MIRKEWQRLLKNPVLIVVVAAIILIPSIYAGFFLASMWDPYGELDKLPVAVVNLDRGAVYDGKELQIGQDLADNLREDGSLNFTFTDEASAEQGLRDGVRKDMKERRRVPRRASDADPHKDIPDLGCR